MHPTQREHVDFLHHLRAVCGLDPARPVIVGVSGGPDSLCLLDILHENGYSVVVAHFNHGLRAEAGEDARFVQELAGAMNLPFVIGSESVADYADEHSLSIEEAARLLRYRFLFRIARQHQAQAVTVGHTADDQVETVLMHFLRGTGLNGLRGMAYRTLLPEFDAEIPLVRPLLSVWREEVLQRCQARGLTPRQDASNASFEYLRNRVRHALIPALQEYNPRIRQAIWRMARNLRDDYDVLLAAVEELWPRLCLSDGPGYVTLDAAVLSGTPAGLQRNLLRRALEQVRPGLQGLDFETLERAAAFVAWPRLSQADLTAGVRLLREGNRLHVAAWEADLPLEGWPRVQPDAELLRLTWPGVWEIAPGWTFRAEAGDSPDRARQEALRNPDPYQAWLDADRLVGLLQVRSPRPGDRFQPLGMGGHTVKLSDFFINARLPRRARPGWPLVCDEEKILWIPGFRPAHGCRLRQETTRVLYLQLTHTA